MAENETPKDNKAEVTTDQKTKKHNVRRYVFYVSFVLIATGIALYLSLRNNFNDVIGAFKTCNWTWVLAIFGVMVLAFSIDGLIIWVFMRLYSRSYRYRQGVAVSLVGNFYSGITPGSSGGQVMQAYTLKKQGSQISSAASILVMYFILYQVALIIFDIVTVSFKWNLLQTIGSVQVLAWNAALVPLTIMGFALNLFLIGILFVMSYSHRVHNFIMHYGIGLLSKLHIVKNPDKSRETLRIQVENFKIELRRLQSNIPVAILITVLFLLALVCRFSIPWFAGMALNGYGYHVNAVGEIVHTTGYANFSSVWDACFMSSYHQMVSGLIPLPGGAGISEIMFTKLFENFYTTSANVSAAQIIWRASTFHVPLLFSGFFAAFYKATPKEKALEADRRTFVTMQFETYEERKQSSDTSYETSQLSRKELQNRLREVLLPKIKKERPKKKSYVLDDTVLNDNSPFTFNNEITNKKVDKKHKKEEDDWRDFNIN